MPAKAYGNTGAALVLMPGYPVYSLSDKNIASLTYRYWCNDTSAEGLIPAYNSAPPGGVHTTFKRREVSLSPHEAPHRIYMEVVYREPSGNVVSTGDVFRSSDTSMQEKPLDEHPSLTDAEKAALKAKGRNTFLQFSVTYRRRNVVAAASWSESYVTSGVGARGAPAGLSGASAAKWMKVGRTISESDQYDEVEDIYAYDANTWDSDIYP